MTTISEARRKRKADSGRYRIHDCLMKCHLNIFLHPQNVFPRVPAGKERRRFKIQFDKIQIVSRVRRILHHFAIIKRSWSCQNFATTILLSALCKYFQIVMRLDKPSASRNRSLAQTVSRRLMRQIPRGNCNCHLSGKRNIRQAATLRAV